MAQPDTCIQSEEELVDAARIRDMLSSVGALLTGLPQEAAVLAARGTALEARAVAETLIDKLERRLAVEHERMRAEARR
jgi:hypothetical protein